MRTVYELRDKRGKCQEAGKKAGIGGGEWLEINQLLIAVDTALVADLE